MENINLSKQISLKEILKDLLPLIHLDLFTFENLHKVQETNLFATEKILECALKRGVNSSKTQSINSLMFRKRTKRAIPEDIVGKIKVALLGFDKSSLSYLIKYLCRAPFKKFAVIDIGDYCPSPRVLSSFDVIIIKIGRNGRLKDQFKFGTILMQYLLDGKSIIFFGVYGMVSCFNYRLDGLIISSNCLPISQGRLGKQASEKPVNFLKPDHPILEDVKPFSVESDLFVIAEKTKHANVIATRFSGTPLVSTKHVGTKGGLSIVLNFGVSTTKNQRSKLDYHIEEKKLSGIQLFMLI